MKTVDRRFVMRMLEKERGKPAKQIEEEAANWDPEWPAGTGELESFLGASVGYARTILEYFQRTRPAYVTREDIEEIVRRNSNRKVFTLTDTEIERHRKSVYLVFDVYEESDDHKPGF